METKILMFLFITAITKKCWTLQCYECFDGPIDYCGDPFDKVGYKPVTCPTSSTTCIKRKYKDVGTGNTFIERTCEDTTCKDHIDLHAFPGIFSDVQCYECDEDLCNGLEGYDGPIKTTLTDSSSTTTSATTTTMGAISTTTDATTTTIGVTTTTAGATMTTSVTTTTTWATTTTMPIIVDSCNQAGFITCVTPSTPKVTTTTPEDTTTTPEDTTTTPENTATTPENTTTTTATTTKTSETNTTVTHTAITTTTPPTSTIPSSASFIFLNDLILVSLILIVI